MLNSSLRVRRDNTIVESRSGKVESEGKETEMNHSSEISWTNFAERTADSRYCSTSILTVLSCLGTSEIEQGKT